MRFNSNRLLLILLCLIGYVVNAAELNPVCSPPSDPVETPVNYVFVLDHTFGTEKVNKLKYLMKAISCEIPNNPKLSLQIAHVSNDEATVSYEKNSVEFATALAITLNVGPADNDKTPCIRLLNVLTQLESSNQNVTTRYIVPVDTDNKACPLTDTFKASFHDRDDRKQHFFDGIVLGASLPKTEYKIYTSWKALDVTKPSLKQSTNFQDIYHYANLLQQISKWVSQTLNPDIPNSLYEDEDTPNDTVVGKREAETATNTTMKTTETQTTVSSTIASTSIETTTENEKLNTTDPILPAGLVQNDSTTTTDTSSTVSSNITMEVPPMENSTTTVSQNTTLESSTPAIVSLVNITESTPVSENTTTRSSTTAIVVPLVNSTDSNNISSSRTVETSTLSASNTTFSLLNTTAQTDTTETVSSNTTTHLPVLPSGSNTANTTDANNSTQVTTSDEEVSNSTTISNTTMVPTTEHAVKTTVTSKRGPKIAGFVPAVNETDDKFSDFDAPVLTDAVDLSKTEAATVTEEPGPWFARWDWLYLILIIIIVLLTLLICCLCVCCCCRKKDKKETNKPGKYNRLKPEEPTQKSEASLHSGSDEKTDEVAPLPSTTPMMTSTRATPAGGYAPVPQNPAKGSAAENTDQMQPPVAVLPPRAPEGAIDPYSPLIYYPERINYDNLALSSRRQTASERTWRPREQHDGAAQPNRRDSVPQLNVDHMFDE